MIWFTSDTHFGHRNIIRYCNRPFKNVWEMNHQLIENWNAVVRREDIVYHLGDFAFLPARQIREVIDSLNGNIILVVGNHDNVRDLVHDRLEIYPNFEFLTKDSEQIYMSHYPEVTAANTDQVGFCGHIHTQWRSWLRPDGKLIYNLGTDVWDYHPVCMGDIEADMADPQNRVVGEWKDAYHD